jgi:hypothetical protein
MTGLTKEAMDQMLEEVAGYMVHLEEDPTLPELGTKYLQGVLAQCRNYSNRIVYYLQLCMRAERALLTEIKQAELDFDFKVKEKLADDVIVRQQRALDDRKALAESLMKTEAENLIVLRVQLIDVQESVKLLKFKYGDLTRTSQDIKTQRALVKDDKMAQLAGEDGYNRPQINPDRSVPNGMSAPVAVEPLGPKDILDPSKRPEELPEPVDEAHARQILEFLSRNPEKQPTPTPETNGERKKNGLVCSICKSPQYENPSGPFCDNGHGGADGALPPESLVNTGVDVSYVDLLT